MIDLTKIGAWFTENKLWEKPFNTWTREEMEELATVFFSSPGSGVPRDGWKTPYVEGDSLVIPFDSHPRFHWWTEGGQSIIDTMLEIRAPQHIIESNMPVGWNPLALKQID